jgi:3D (Asp-Asp-Asp) domain-containing protein
MVYPIEGLTIAGPRRFPFGSVVILSDGRKFVIQDRLARKYDNRFDIFVHSHKKAKKMGIIKGEKVMVITNN